MKNEKTMDKTEARITAELIADWREFTPEELKLINELFQHQFTCKNQIESEIYLKGHPVFSKYFTSAYAESPMLDLALRGLGIVTAFVKVVLYYNKEENKSE